MRTATATIRNLIDQVSQGALRLPEIQRAYVWKPAQVAGLVDSLYRRYPSGSILLWETTETVTEKDLATSVGDGPVFVVKPLYLLDGQQRLTSLHRVFTGHERARVVFNIVTERFQIESAATKRDRRWVLVYELLGGEVDTFGLVQELAPVAPELTPAELHERLERVRRIGDYSYFLEILDDLPYPEVTEVFVRVNSRGRALKDTDLALATLSARWPGVVARIDELVERQRAERYNDLDTAFLVRAFAALANESTSPSAFATTSIEQLEEAWKQLERGIAHTVNLLVAEVGLDNSKLLPSANALVPLVYYFGTRPDTPLGADERNALVYWLLVAAIQARYSASAATVIAQDVTALRAADPLRSLCSNLGLLNTKIEITPAALAGKGSTSPFFLLSYLVVRQKGARDWWYGSPVALSHDGAYSVEYHHIHPRARLRTTYSKAEINDLANLAFISDKANRKILARSPVDYFQELAETDASYLADHLVPSDPAVRAVEAYPAFIEERRRLLAHAMNELLESYRPSFVDAEASEVAAEAGATLSIDAYGTSVEADDIQLVFQSVLDGATRHESVTFAALDGLLRDIGDGLGGELEVGGELLSFAGDTEIIEVPIGPLLVGGTVEEWRKVLDRELSDIRPLDEMPAHPSEAWEGHREELSILESD